MIKFADAIIIPIRNNLSSNCVLLQGTNLYLRYLQKNKLKFFT
jgi:hypothetical protein